MLKIEDLHVSYGGIRALRGVSMEVPDGRIVTAEGYIYGEITREKRGSNGFGYDPLFLVPELGLTTAELEPDAKNAISHRANALHALVEKL